MSIQHFAFKTVMALATAALTLLLSGRVATAGHDAPRGDQLLVFVQASDTPIDRGFREEHLPAILTLGGELELETKVVEIGDAAPDLIGLTPLIVHASHRGRSIYQGRYTTLDRVRNFVQTARVIPQDDAPLTRESIPVWTRGRMKVATPIKITTLSGTVPEGFAREQFEQEARQGIAEGLTRFRLEPRVELSRTDRQFYVDFHPYRSESGELFLSTALFSQFHCHEPVHVSPEPVSGPWEDRQQVFAAAARDLQRHLEDTIASSAIGDGFDPVAGTVRAVGWEEFGLPLPVRSASATGDALAANVELPLKWIVDELPQLMESPVRFSFLPPLDNYAGQAQSLHGELELGPDHTFSTARGKFVVPADTITMGERDLDEFIRGNAVLDTAKYPDSTFVFDHLSSDHERLEPATITPARLHGRFLMKDKAIPLEVPVQLEIVIGPNGAPELLLEGIWTVDILEPFGIQGPDGPPEAARTLRFFCNLVLVG